MAALCLHCYTQAFSGCSMQPSHCSGFLCCGAWPLGCAGRSFILFQVIVSLLRANKLPSDPDVIPWKLTLAQPTMLGSPSLPVCMWAKLLQSCPTFWDPMDHSLADSSVHGILQARILKWVAVSSSRGSSPPKDQTCISNASYIAGEFFLPLSHWRSPLPFLMSNIAKCDWLSLFPLCWGHDKHAQKAGLDIYQCIIQHKLNM